MGHCWVESLCVRESGPPTDLLYSLSVLPFRAGTFQRKREVKCVEERMDREAIILAGLGRGGQRSPIHQPRRVVSSGRHPGRKGYLKDNKETVPGRAVGRGTWRRPRRALIRWKGEEQELVTVKRMWHPPWCHKGGHSTVLERVPSLAQLRGTRMSLARVSSSPG